MADRFGATRSLVVSLLLLSIVLTILSLATTELLTGLPELFLWGAAAASIFAPQQYRLLSLAPAHTNVLLALLLLSLWVSATGSVSRNALIEDAPEKEKTDLIERVGI